jgi:hypothetical protein
MTEREQFEDWKATIGPETTSIQDIDDCMWLMAWAAWQARAALSQQQAEPARFSTSAANFGAAMLALGHCPSHRRTEMQAWADEARAELMRAALSQQQAEPALRLTVTVDDSNPLDRHHFELVWLTTPHAAGEYLYYAAPPAVQQAEPECTLDTFAHGTKGNRYRCDRCGKLYAQHSLPQDDAPDTQQQAEPDKMTDPVERARYWKLRALAAEGQIKSASLAKKC